MIGRIRRGVKTGFRRELKPVRGEHNEALMAGAKKIYPGSVANGFVFEPAFWSLEADGSICFRPSGARFLIGCGARDRAAEVGDYHAMISHMPRRRANIGDLGRHAVMAYLHLRRLLEPVRTDPSDLGASAPRVN